MVKENTDQNKEALRVLLKIRYLWWTGDSYVKAVADLQKINTGNFVSIEFLSTQAIEILLKSYLGARICVDNKEKNQTQISDLIDRSFRKVSHNLEKIFNEVEDLKSLLNIDYVEIISNGFVSDYRLNMKNGDVFSFKELESVRYGSFAKNTNIVNGSLFQGQLEFLQDLSKIIHDKISDSINLLKQ